MQALSGPLTITFNGTGQLPATSVRIDTGATSGTAQPCPAPCVVDYGQVLTGVPSSSQVVKVVNNGTGTIAVNSVLVTPLGSPYQVTPPGATPIQLTTNQSAVFGVQCTPIDGANTSTMTITSQGVLPGSPTLVRTVELRCQGIRSDVSSSDAMLPLFTRVHETVSVQAAIVNAGAAPATITAVSSDLPGLQTNLVATTVVAANSDTKFNVTYTPDAPLDNVEGKIGTLTIDLDDGVAPKTIEVLLTGPIVATTFSLAPTPPGATADLGVACLGDTLTEQFTMTATAGGSFKLSDLSIVFNQGIYNIVPRVPPVVPTFGSPHDVAGNGGTVEFDVTFQPQTTGIVPGVISMSTDIPQTTAFAVGLVGVGVPTGEHVTPLGPIDFGTVATGQTSGLQIVRFTNCSSGRLAITSARITGDADFSIATTPSFDVAANGTAEFELVLAPEFGGSKRGQLEIEYAGGLKIVTLIGNGDGPLPPQPPAPANVRDSYYACRAGGSPGWAWLLVIACGVWLFRRRRHG